MTYGAFRGCFGAGPGPDLVSSSRGRAEGPTGLLSSLSCRACASGTKTGGTSKTSLPYDPRNHPSSRSPPWPQAQGWDGHPGALPFNGIHPRSRGWWPLTLPGVGAGGAACRSVAMAVVTACHPRCSPSRWRLHPSTCPDCPRSHEEVTPAPSPYKTHVHI